MHENGNGMTTTDGVSVLFQVRSECTWLQGFNVVHALSERLETVLDDDSEASLGHRLPFHQVSGLIGKFHPKPYRSAGN